MDIIEEAKLVFDIEIAELKKIRDRIDDEIEKAAEIIMAAKGKVVITGIGKSGLVGKKMAATFASTGTLSIFMNSAEGLHGDLGMISKDDVVIAISNSGNSDEVVGILPAVKKIGAKKPKRRNGQRLNETAVYKPNKGIYQTRNTKH